MCLDVRHSIAFQLRRRHASCALPPGHPITTLSEFFFPPIPLARPVHLILLDFISGLTFHEQHKYEIYIMPLSSCGLRENPGSERHTVLRGANGLLVPPGLSSSHMSTTMHKAPLSFSTIGRGKAVLSLLAQIKLRLRLYREVLRHSEIKGRLSNVCAVRHKVHRHLQCCD